jgi:hypothetical protein
VSSRSNRLGRLEPADTVTRVPTGRSVGSGPLHSNWSSRAAAIETVTSRLPSPELVMDSQTVRSPIENDRQRPSPLSPWSMRR